MRTDALWVGLILLGASLTVSTLVSSTVGYVLTLLIYVAFVGTLVATDRFAVVYHWAVLPMVLLIWAVFALTTALAPTGAGIVRLGAFTAFTGVNLFVVPAVIDRETFHTVLAGFAGAAVLIGLPTVLLGTYGVGGVRIVPWHSTMELAGVVLQRPVSVFDNPNYLAGFSALGAIAAGAVYARSGAGLAAGLIGLNALGVYLAGGRAALLALVVAGLLYATHRYRGRDAMALLVVVGGTAGVVGLAVWIGIVPGPSVVRGIDFGSRRAIWTAAYEAVLDRPAIGWGPGRDRGVLAEYMGQEAQATHNSYLRMFLIGGVLGGGAYLLLSGTTLLVGLRNARSERLFTVLLLVAFLILQLFSGATIFGLSLLSTLGALVVGFAQSSAEPVRRVELDTGRLVLGSGTY